MNVFSFFHPRLHTVWLNYQSDVVISLSDSFQDCQVCLSSFKKTLVWWANSDIILSIMRIRTVLVICWVSAIQMLVLDNFSRKWRPIKATVNSIQQRKDQDHHKRHVRHKHRPVPRYHGLTVYPQTFLLPALPALIGEDTFNLTRVFE